jgi:hypothetical protein
MGNVSQIVPTFYPAIDIDTGCPLHSDGFNAASGTDRALGMERIPSFYPHYNSFWFQIRFSRLRRHLLLLLALCWVTPKWGNTSRPRILTLMKELPVDVLELFLSMMADDFSDASISSI